MTSRGTRLAVFSDIHGNLEAFEAAWTDFEAQGGADYIWFLGDLAAFGPRPSECVAKVMHVLANGGDAVRAIRGNTDRYLVFFARPHFKLADNPDQLPLLIEQMRQTNDALLWGLARLTYAQYRFLATMPEACELNISGYGRVIGYHGVPGHDQGVLLSTTPNDEAVLFFDGHHGRLGIGGHIHWQMDRRLPGTDWRVVNVGSVGYSREKPGYAQYGLFTFADGDVQVDLRNVPFDVDAVIADLRARDYPSLKWTESFLRTGKGA